MAMQAIVDFIFPSHVGDEPNIDESRVITQAFLNSPCYVEVFRGDEAFRREAMEFLFRRNLYLVKTKCPECVRCFRAQDGEITCFFMLVPSFGAHHTMYEKIFEGGILEFGIRYGFNVLSRLIKLSDFADAIDEEFMKGRKYYNLQRMIVTPEQQGKGIGSKYLGEALKQADSEQIPVILTTQEERNTVFYARRGFKLVKQTQYPTDDPNYAFTNYVMIREPQPVH
mmetsp:Transcript_112105/g.219762  ORF Transcript_112105/g.219762 Transcript_112105/m.219762 type:complete len:226 (+) Transcript_112105:20-697(+)|eukprot:CAMPEP_0170364560 /NCGR_PEP_ID=MMETSP0117_2-20130122/5438_1 /TAXON_ID=400756 /ORGANISM="Durinskia baltica, Strain CSIRO CS-38" /LENGTH=225 /DNA_ID=CAMNT_0010619067 /DNA_START=30 /DNA_END=707 /DNA_ORIENTATION=-